MRITKKIVFNRNDTLAPSWLVISADREDRTRIREWLAARLGKLCLLSCRVCPVMMKISKAKVAGSRVL